MVLPLIASLKAEDTIFQLREIQKHFKLFVNVSCKLRCFFVKNFLDAQDSQLFQALGFVTRMGILWSKLKFVYSHPQHHVPMLLFSFPFEMKFSPSSISLVAVISNFVKDSKQGPVALCSDGYLIAKQHVTNQPCVHSVFVGLCLVTFWFGGVTQN